LKRRTGTSEREKEHGEVSGVENVELLHCDITDYNEGGFDAAFVDVRSPGYTSIRSGPREGQWKPWG
jgi:hypothetical protein